MMVVMSEPSEQGPVVRPGDTGKNFSLKDQNDKTFDLLENSGLNTILSFHPLAWTAFCAAQMSALEKNYTLFGSLRYCRGRDQRRFRALQKSMGRLPQYHEYPVALRFLAARHCGPALWDIPGGERVFRAGQYHSR